MVEITSALIFYFFTIAIVLGFWSVAVATRPRDISQPHSAPGERSSHSNLTLLTIGIFSFFFLPLILVGVRWSKGGDQVSTQSYLFILSFLLMGVVSYTYFIRTVRGGGK